MNEIHDEIQVLPQIHQCWGIYCQLMTQSIVLVSISPLHLLIYDMSLDNSQNVELNIVVLVVTFSYSSLS
jgi:hypothetical protein